MAEHPSLKLPAEKRKHLFKVASAEFAAHGFTQASLNGIITAVGMSKSSFYHYFKNKTDLFQQTLDQIMEPFLKARDAFDPEQLTEETFWPIVRTVTREMAHMANRSPEMVIVGRMFYQSVENPEEKELTERVLSLTTDWLARLLRRGQTLGLIRRDLPESFLMDNVMSLGMSMDRWFLAHWDEFTDAERMALNEKAFDLMMRVLEPSE